VTAGNAGDARAAGELLADDLDTPAAQRPTDGPPAEQPEDPEAQASQPASGETEEPTATEPEPTGDCEPTAAEPEPTATAAEPEPTGDCEPTEQSELDPDVQRLSVYGDSAYGSGELLGTLEQADAEVNCKVQPPVAPGGRFAKDAFQIDLESGTVSCPAGHTVTLIGPGVEIRGARRGRRLALGSKTGPGSDPA